MNTTRSVIHRFGRYVFLSLLSVTLGSLLPVLASAQDTPPDGPPPPPPPGQNGGRWGNPQQRLDAQVKRLTERLNLTDEQVVQVKSILKSSMDQRMDLMKKARENSDGGRPDFRAMRKQMQALRESTNDQLKKVLTADQFTQFQKMESEMRAHMRKRMKDRRDNQ